jgi:hypothetical protein
MLCHKFCVKLGEGATDTYEKIRKVFANDSLSRAQVFRWHKDFVNGRETVERSGRPASVRTSTNLDRVKTFIRQDRLLTIRMTANELDINECTVHQIHTQDLHMRKLCAKMVPNNVNDQKARRNKVSVEMLKRPETGHVLNRVITGDESSFFEYDRKTKRESEE